LIIESTTKKSYVAQSVGDDGNRSAFTVSRRDAAIHLYIHTEKVNAAQSVGGDGNHPGMDA